MGSTMISRAVLLALCCACAVALTPLSAAGDDNDCALYLSGPGRTSAYDYSLNLLKGNFGYEGQHTCVTYDAVNQAYLEARNRILVSQPKGDWKPEDFASVGELILDISINLARRYGLTYEEIEKGLPLIDTSRTLIREVCPPVFSHVECRAGKYRRLDGLCNNLQHPTWGAINAPFQRLIGPLFADGINAPRISHTGRDLPLSRVVSRTMHPDDGFHDHAGTVMVIAWGQFMDHDYTLTGTPLDPRNRNDPEECCNRPPHLKHPYCNEIRIPDDDYFYRLFNVKCIDFVRGFPSPRPGCRLGSRVPFNTLTGAIDGNTVYGVTDKFSRKLRTGFGGLLRMNPVFKEYGLKDLLPLKLDIPDEGCTRPNKNMYCFEAGEIRVNEQLVLTVMHTLMAREHNRVAGALGAVNPHWDDETLFQEARRINIAEIQHITYNEFLPILLGKDVMEKFGLVLEKQDYWDGYDEHVNPDVLASFAAAAYRFGHSLLPTAVERWSKAHKFIASKRLSDLIRRPYDLYRAGVLDEYVMGLMNQVAQAMDDSITQEVTNHLFKKVGARFGMDLVSFNMQRGREFGLPGYMEFRKFCGLSGADTFQDLFGAMSNDTVRKYETIFEHPIDVDLWSGGVSERPLPGSMLGPTFACVIATQFSYSRRGDRFWFELPNQPSSFTPEQLTEIRKARLARVICDNTDIIDTVQLYPMVLPDHELNPRVPCRSGILPTIDFTKWAEPAPFHSAKQFMTDAYIPAKNETDCEEQVEKVIDNISATVPTVPVAQHTECNETADPNAAQSSVLNTHSTNNNTTTNNSPTTIQDCAHNTEDTQATNCTETPVNSPEIRDGDTVLKYVYKNDENTNLPEKSKGHAKNSLKRKKRAVNSYKDNARYAESVPLIVNYKTSHSPNQGEKPFERIRDVIKNSHLADFNIETLHGDTQSRKNSDNIKEPPKREYFKPKVLPKLREISKENNNREEFKDNRRNNKPFKDSKDSGEGSTYNDQRRESEHNRNSKPYGQREDSRDRTDYRPRDEPPRNRDSKPYQEDEENDDGEDYNVSIKEPLEERERKPYRESEENTDRSDHREKQPIRESDHKPYRESDESTERSVHIPSQKEPVRERDQKPNRDSDESTERDEYKDRKEPLRERDNKPYRESDESTEKSYYRDSKKEPVQERGRKPYLESDENSEKGDYRNSRREPIRERDSTPHRESDESSERSDYRDRNEPLRERNNKPYRESEESTERSNYRNSRKESDEARDSKPYRESEESTEKGDYRDSRKEPHRERNSKPYRESDESDERSDIRERDSKPYRESDESSDNGEYRDTKRENRDEENRKPYRESKSERKNAYRENHREPHSDRGSYESDEKDYPRNKAPYSSPPKDSNESRDIEQSDETRYPRRGYTRNNKEPYTAPSKDSRESRESERSEESSYPKRSDSREDGNYYNTENDKLPYIKPRSESTESNGNANSSYQKEPTSGPTSTEKDYYKSNGNSNLRQPPPYNDGSDEEEEIIAIMRKKNRKIHDKPLNKYNSDIKDQPSTSTPIKLKDVDLDDFSYERIQVNDKGVVEPSKETHENYDTDTQVEIVPITTAIPVVVKENVEQYSRSIESIDTPSSAEINDDNNPQIHINDGEIKPVVEINRDSIELRDENSKEALKNSPDNEDTSLESLLGVKITDSDDANVKPILKHEPKQKGDVKQQFERIPLNYNHNQKDHNEKESSIKPEENKSESDDEDTTQNQGTLDILTPKDHSYDENLNIKFDDLAIKLPEINLPKDILAYTYEDPPYEKQKDEEKPKFYQYNDEYTEEKPREQKNRDDEDYDDRPHDKYSGYYGNNKKKDDYTKKQQDNDDDLHHIYPSYYADDKKKDEYTKKQKEEDEEHEGENDDLYEKFVRERFGKRGSFEKRSEKIQELPIRPIKANAKLFNTIQQVLKKTEDVQKQAEKSGDPNAAYMWTLEYGQKL